MSSSKIVRTAAALAGLLTGMDASAQSAALDEVVVTATRRAENLQEVPLAVSAVSGEVFTDSTYAEPTDVQYVSPSVQTSRSGGVGFYVRGIGTTSYDLSSEQTVGLVVDDVVYGFVDEVSADLSDMTQMAVLRGPQGTQFGKNASGGLVQITTRRPNFDKFGVTGLASFGTYNYTNSNLSMNLPLTNKLAASVSGDVTNRDWFMNNPVRNTKHEGGQKQYGTKGKLLWQPTDNLTAYAIVDYRRTHRAPDIPTTYQFIGHGGGLVGPGFGLPSSITPGYENTQTNIPQDSFRDIRVGGASLNLEYQLGSYRLTSVSAFRRMELDQYMSVGGTTIPYFEGPVVSTGNQYTQELRVASAKEQRIQFVAGAYYYRRTTEQTKTIFGPAGGLGQIITGQPGAIVVSRGGTNITDQKLDSIAGFADGTVALIDNLKLILGARFTHDKAAAYSIVVPIPGTVALSPPILSDHSSIANSNFSYRAGLQYDISSSVMAYATLASGYKGPLAVADGSARARTVKPESVRAYEIGLKSTLFEDKATINVAAFDEKFTDFQTSVLDTAAVPPVFVLGNAGGVRSRGVEVETALRIARPLSISASATYVDNKFTDFKTSCYSPVSIIPLPVTTDPAAIRACYTIPGTRTSYFNAQGMPNANASKWNFTGSVSVEQPITAGFKFDGIATFFSRSAFYTVGQNPNTRVRGYSLVNLNLGISPNDEVWRVGIFVKNLFDKYYLSAIEPSFADQGGLLNIPNIDAKRAIGVVVKFSF